MTATVQQDCLIILKRLSPWHNRPQNAFRKSELCDENFILYKNIKYYRFLPEKYLCPAAPSSYHHSTSLLFLSVGFSPSGGLGCCCCFWSGSLRSSATCQPSTCGASPVVRCGSSPFWPGNLGVGVCTSPLMPAGGAVRPGRWEAGRQLLYCTHTQRQRERKGV